MHFSLLALRRTEMHSLTAGIENTQAPSSGACAADLWPWQSSEEASSALLVFGASWASSAVTTPSYSELLSVHDLLYRDASH